MDFYINIARFHPLLVHLPIGILIFSIIMEFLNWKNKNEDFNKAIRISFIVGLLASIGAIITGLLLADEGGYEELALSRHKWMGISVMGLTALLLILDSFKKRFLNAYRIILLILVVLLSITGHLGGNLTHGSEYLFTKSDEEQRAVADIQQELAYETVIAPILSKKCNSCHNPSKTKGDLVMTTHASLLIGGKNGPVVDPNNPDNSTMIKRVHLPANDKKHMPPKGKSQLSDNEIKLIEWWLDNEACNDCLVSSMKGNESVASILTSYNSSAADNIVVDPVDMDEVNKLISQGVKIQPQSKNSPLVLVNLANRKDLSKKLFDQLDEIAENVIELNLAQSNFSDTLAGFLKGYMNLHKIQLQNTQITDQAISNLAALEYLQSLNLYGTRITDQSVGALEKIETLKNIYLWQSDVTDKGVDKLMKSIPQLNAQYKFDNEVFGEAKLRPPLVESESKLFNDSMLVALNSSFKSAEIYYTINGEDPDTNSIRYEKPFYVTESVQVKTYSYKKGWDDSPVEEAQFVKAGLTVDRAFLLNDPSGKYQGNGAKTLIDLQKGSERFTDGQWLGYEGNDMTVQLEIATAREVSEVFVSALSAQSSWIFFPSGVSVYTSMDGKKFKLAVKVDLKVEETTTISEMNYFKVGFNSVKAKYVRVVVENIKENPSWHPAPGGKSWIFVDEIMLQ